MPYSKKEIRKELEKMPKKELIKFILKWQFHKPITFGNIKTTTAVGWTYRNYLDFVLKKVLVKSKKSLWFDEKEIVKVRIIIQEI